MARTLIPASARPGVRYLIWIVVAIFFSSVPATVSKADDPELSEEQRRILVVIVTSDEPVTKELHDRFWMPYRESKNPEAQRSMAELAHRHELILLAYRYQKEAWSCARSSYLESTVVRTAGLDQLEKEALEVAAQSPGSEQKYHASFENTQRLLEASANHTSLSTPQGAIEIDLELISNTIANLEGVVNRVSTLLGPEWHED